jgi:dUTP pyrophosphatase
MKIKFKKLTPKALTPEYKTEGSAGLDLYSVETVTIPPHRTALIKTGIAIELPDGYEMQIRGRSGLSLKSNYICKTGTVDSDYRGEIGVIIHNLSDEDLVLDEHTRIAQGIINKIEHVELEEAESLSTTLRNTNGFGSTGL